MKLVIAILIFFGASSIFATGAKEDLKLKRSDISLKAGAGLWKISQPLENGTERVVTYGGLPISIGYYIDYSQSYTVQLGAQMVFDIIGEQVSGTGGYVMLAWHVCTRCQCQAKIKSIECQKQD